MLARLASFLAQMVGSGSEQEGSSSLSPASRMLEIADRVAEEELRANGGTMVHESDEGRVLVAITIVIFPLWRPIRFKSFHHMQQ